MRTPRLLAAAALLSIAPPALAQLRNRSVSVESGVSAPLAAGADARGVAALSATAWLHGAVEAVARVGLASAPQTAGRAPAAAVTGTAGVRVSLLPDPLRPQLGLELGWARVDGEEGSRDRIALGVNAGLEWFPARDVSIAARAAMRAAGAAPWAELTLGLAAYF